MSKQFTYDEVPYPNFTFAQTHPNRLATIGTLVGMHPAPPAHCRVLELGCASGANLLPMAYHFPESTFVGIDLGEKHIKEAKALQESLNLHNIIFEQMNILDVPEDFGDYDYIIVHGIFSWVPRPVQDKIFEICRRHLAPQGIAYISYNVYPGWHMLGMARGLMRFYTRGEDKPFTRAAYARNIIDFFNEALPLITDTAYHRYFFHAYKGLLDGYSANRHYHRDTILIHDALADLNQPFYFHEFIAWAEQYQLQYLGEAEFPAMMPANFAENVANKIGHYAKNVIETEQYIDFVRNTTFRRTLLCHQEIPLAREIKPEVIENFKLASFANTLVAPDENPLDAILDPTKAQVFTLGDGTKFATVHTFTKAAFHHLLSISPLSIDFAGLVEAVCAKLNISEASFEDVNLLAASLLQAHSYSMQFLELQMYAPHFVVEVSPYPEVNPYGRLTMRGVQAVNMRHELVELTTTGAKLLPYVDGTRSHEDLLNILLDLFDQGKLVLEHLGSQVQDRYLAEELLIEELNVTLKHFALSALLVA